MKNFTIWVLMLLFGGSDVRLLAQSNTADHLFRDFKSLIPDPNIGKISALDIAVRQDGLVILAANQGVITYDGERWNRLEHPKYRRCTSVAVDSRGVIYVGFDADFGILEPSPEDGFRFRSLVAEFPELDSTPPICLRIELHDDEVYFGCTIGIANWNAKSQTPGRWQAIEPGYKAQSFWLSQGTLHAAIVNDQLFRKIVRYRNETLASLVELSEQDLPTSFVVGGCAYSESEQLVLSYSQGLFKVSEGHVQPFECEASTFATTNFAKGIRECPDGTFALAGEKGLAFFDRDGHVLDHLLVSENDELGVGRNNPFIDHEEQLWIPTHGLGAAIQIDLRSAVRRWKSKVISPSWAIQRDSNYWIGGTGMVRNFTDSDRSTTSFDFEVPRSHDVIAIDDEILFTTTSGIWVAPLLSSAVSSRPEQESNEASSESNQPSMSGPARTIVGAGSATTGVHLPGTNSVLIATIDSGIRWYQKMQGEWMLRGTLPGISSECLDTKFDPARSRLWFSSRSEQGRWFAGRLNLDPLNPMHVSDIQLYEDQVAETNSCFTIWNGRVLFNSRDGLKWFDDNSGRFEDLDLPLPSPDKQGIINAIEVDPTQQLWVHVVGEGLYRIDRDGVADLAYPAINGVSRIQMNPESKSIYLISTSSDLYQIPIQRNRVEKKLPEINSIRRLGNSRSNRNIQSVTRESNVYSIAYAAQSANLHPFAKYQFRLLNLSNEWSPWSNESQQTFRGLAPGSYEFQVRCQSKWLEAGPVQSIALIIPSPWYATWWARSLVGLMLISGTFVAVTLRINSERERANRLEQSVRERTSELSQAKSELELRVRSRTQDLELANRQLLEEIDQRRRAEQSLFESELRYRTIVEGQSEMIVRFDTHGQITFANQAFCRQFHIPEPKVLGTNLFALMDPQLPSMLEELAAKGPAIQEAISLRQHINRFQTPVWEDWTIHAMLDSTGLVTTFQAVGRDVTTLVETQEELRHKEDFLRHASRLSMLGEMVASITHELRQPLGSISNFAFATEQSLHQVNSEQARQLAAWNHQIVEQIARADSIVRRLRGFARRADAELEPCNVNRVIEDTLAMLQFELRKAEVEVKLVLASQLPEIRYVRVQLEQVLVNLIRNACDAMVSLPSDRRHIAIETTNDGNGIVVRVSDSGPGVMESQSAQVFQPFYSTKKEGLGLGLAISRSIIEDAGGTIWLDTRQPGATFAFTLQDMVRVH